MLAVAELIDELDVAARVGNRCLELLRNGRDEAHGIALKSLADDLLSIVDEHDLPRLKAIGHAIEKRCVEWSL